MRAPQELGSFILCLLSITGKRKREGEWGSSLQQIFFSERKEILPLLAGGRRVVLINQHDRARILKSNLKGALTTGNLAQLSFRSWCRSWKLWKLVLEVWSQFGLDVGPEGPWARIWTPWTTSTAREVADLVLKISNCVKEEETKPVIWLQADCWAVMT